MAFPVVEGVASTDITTATTGPVINLPSGIIAGELLFVHVRNAAGGIISWPSGWTEIGEAGGGAADDTDSWGYRVADGTEGSTITLTFTNSGKGAAIARRISGAADPAVQLPQLSNIRSGTSSTPLPNGLSPTGGAKDYLWLWVGGWEGEQTSPPATVPANYSGWTGAQSGTAGSTASNCRLASGWRQLNTATENPGSTSLSVSGDWTAYTIVFHPSTGVNVSPARLGVATVPSPTVIPGAVTVGAPPLLGTASLLAPQKFLTGITIPSLGSAIVYSPTVVPGLVSVAPTLLGTAIVPAPTAALGGGVQSVSASLLGSAVLYSPTATPGSIGIAPDRLGLATLHDATVVKAPWLVSAPLLGNANLLSPTLQVAGSTVTPGRLGGATLHTVTVTTGTAFVSASRLGPATVPTPTLVVAGVALGLNRLGTAQVLSPSLSLKFAIGRLGLATLPSPSVGMRIAVARLGAASVFSPTFTTVNPVAGSVTTGHAIAGGIVSSTRVLTTASHRLVGDA